MQLNCRETALQYLHRAYFRTMKYLHNKASDSFQIAALSMFGRTSWHLEFFLVISFVQRQVSTMTVKNLSRSTHFCKLRMVNDSSQVRLGDKNRYQDLRSHCYKKKKKKKKKTSFYQNGLKWKE